VSPSWPVPAHAMTAPVESQQVTWPVAGKVRLTQEAVS
jgi:hypothetical protein